MNPEDKDNAATIKQVLKSIGDVFNIRVQLDQGGVWATYESFDDGTFITSVHPGELEARRAMEHSGGVVFVPWGKSIDEVLAS